MSEVLILHEIMARIQYKTKSKTLPKPCDYFDLIGGTSTGGFVPGQLLISHNPVLTCVFIDRLLALMLGRLQMSTDEVLKAYTKLSKKVFSEKKRVTQDGTFKASNLKLAIQEIVEMYGQHKNKDELLLDERSNMCKT